MRCHRISLDRYLTLVRQEATRSLTPEEARELTRMAAAIERGWDAWYEPITETPQPHPRERGKHP